jgi:signal transduction histidine kinase
MSVGTVLVSHRVAEDEAIRDARTRTRATANTVIAPLVTPELRNGDRRAIKRMSDTLEPRIRDGLVRHYRIWDERGVLLWSDVPELVGQRFDVPGDVAEVLGTGNEKSSLPSDRSDHSGALAVGSDLLEVYVGSWGVDGEPFVLEAYIPPDRFEEDEDAILARILPLALGALVLFQLAVLPMAFTLARRLDRARVREAEVLNRSLASWHEERRRLAQDLHDEVIPEVAAVSYVLPSVVAQLPPDSSADPARLVGKQVTGMLEGTVRSLRSLIFDLYPADLGGAGLEVALESLVARARDHGVDVEVEVAGDLDLGADTAGLVYRVVREGMRNVTRHSRAERAWLTIRRDEELVDVRLSDDGRGPKDASESSLTAPGHYGLRLLTDVVSHAGGTLDLQQRQPQGAELHARIPVLLPG